MPNSVSSTLAKLSAQFAAQLPLKFDAIRSAFQRIEPTTWQQPEVEALHRLVHTMNGSAGTFNMHNVSKAAQNLEEKLSHLLKENVAPTLGDWKNISTLVGHLEEIIQLSLNTDSPKLSSREMQVDNSNSPLIYLVEDNIDQAELLKQILLDAGYLVQTFNQAADFRAACNLPETAHPAAVIMDMIFPEGDSVGAELITEMKVGNLSNTPFVVISARDDLSARLAAYRAGACRYQVKPIDPDKCINLLDELTGRQPVQPYRVLMVDDDTVVLEAQAHILRSAGMQVVTLSQPLQILETLKNFVPDIAILDIYMPDASGPELAAVLHERDKQQHLPILFLSSESDLSKQLLALNLGGDNFLVKPVQAEHLIASVTARARRARQRNNVQKRLEIELYEREQEHHALNHHAIVSIADQSGNITYVNEKFCQVSGYDRAELLGQNHRILKSFEHTPDFYAELWKTIARGHVWQGEVCNRRKDGSLYWVDSTITPFLNSDGKPYQYVSIRTDITQVKAIQLALQESEERLRLGQAYANIGTWEWNIQTGVLFWSERIAPLFGHAVGELETSYENFLGAIHPDDRPLVTEAVNACIADDTPYEIEHRVVWPDGTVRWLLERGAVSRDASGKPLQMLGVVQDIDDRKRAELSLYERESQLREAQSLARIGNWTANIVTGDLTWSDEIYRIFGHKPGSFAPSIQAFQAAVHPEDRALVTASEKRAQQTGHHDIVHRIVRSDGVIRHVHELAQAETDASGNLQRLTGTVQDITERVLAERALADSERFLKSLIDIIPGVMGYWTVDLHCTFANKGYLEWFGKSPEQMLNISMTELLGEKLLSLNQPYISAALRGEVQRFERTLTKADGTISYAWAHYIPDFINGEVQGFFAMVSDITEIKQSQIRLEELNNDLIKTRDEAERANKAKSDFLSSMSHELRTPMNAILGFSQLMEYDPNLAESYKENVREILKAGYHLLNLINEILDLSKVESGHIDLSLEPVEIQSVVDECVGLVLTIAKKRGIKITKPASKMASVRADRTRFKQILLNLLSNAIKYNRENGSVRIEIAQAEEGRIRIQVIDTGYGIAASQLDSVFHPFNRLDAANGTIEGTCIGLTITRRIVELMGGSVNVESEVGVGSCFWIELPMDTLPLTHSKENETGIGQLLQTPSTNERQYRVIYIEDNPSNLRLVSQILGMRKHIELYTAHLPELGIELAHTRQPDLILLDINMPGMNGYQVLTVLRADTSLKDIPIIAVTANAMPRDIERGLAAGFAAYLTKPLKIPEFNALLDQYLNVNNPTQ